MKSFKIAYTILYLINLNIKGVQDLINQKLNANLQKEDELQRLIKGCNFLHLLSEVFTIDFYNLIHEFKTIECPFPYLLVNMGSGVSILKVESDAFGPRRIITRERESVLVKRLEMLDEMDRLTAMVFRRYGLCLYGKRSTLN